jgi:hypothetical protein
VLYPHRVRKLDLILGVSILALAGCGGVGGMQVASVPSGGQVGLAGDAGGEPDPSGDEGAEVQALATDVIAPQLCPQLLGSFVGLPGDESAPGAEAGTLPSVGRWWIRSCEAAVVDGRLAFRIAGPGWTWVEQESHGFRIRQYLLFEAEARLTTELSLAYDPDTHIASLWMAPIGEVEATITPRGALTAEATNFFSRVVGGILTLTRADADERARAEAESIGSERLRSRLSAGFTMTFSLDRQQVDFMVGALSRGTTPVRPFPDEPGAPWVVNQRSRIYPGGVDVVGPIPASAEPMALDFALEEGEGVAIRSACADDVRDYLDARFRDPESEPPPPPGSDLLATSSVGVLRRVALAPSACARVLLVAPLARAELPNLMRYRVLPMRELVGSDVEGGAGTRPQATSPIARAPARVRLAVASLTLRPENASGQSWDVIGGGPDVFVVVFSVPMQRELDRSPVQEDTTDARWDRFLPGVYAPADHLPLRFTVFDEDTTTDELIGTAELDATELPPSGGEITLPIVSEGATPVQTGTLRLRIEPVP